MAPAKQMRTMLRTAAVAGLAAFSLNMPARAQDNAASAPARNPTTPELLAMFAKVDVTAMPISDKVLLSDGHERHIIDCEAIRPPKSLTTPEARKNFKSLQAAAMLFGRPANESENQAAQMMVDKIHAACGSQRAMRSIPNL